jgi:chemotaxis protein MotB
MTKQTWIIASILSVAVIIGFISLSAWKQGQLLEQARTELTEARSIAEQTRAQAEQWKAGLERSKTEIEDLQREKQEVTKAQNKLEHEMRSALESKDITISELQGKLTVNILDRILFDSGEAVLKPEGEKVLTRIAGILEQYPKRQIHVIGHTDNVPIRASARDRFASNWELSTTRATAAVRFLQEKANVDPLRLGAVGYGEFHPIAENTTAEGRAKNRRIALVVLPEELSGADLPPPPAGVVPPPETPVLPAPAANTNGPSARSTNSLQ